MMMHINTPGTAPIALAPFGGVACSVVTVSFGAFTPAARLGAARGGLCLRAGCRAADPAITPIAAIRRPFERPPVRAPPLRHPCGIATQANPHPTLSSGKRHHHVRHVVARPISRSGQVRVPRPGSAGIRRTPFARRPRLPARRPVAAAPEHAQRSAERRARIPPPARRQRAGPPRSRAGRLAAALLWTVHA